MVYVVFKHNTKYIFCQYKIKKTENIDSLHNKFLEFLLFLGMFLGMDSKLPDVLYHGSRVKIDTGFIQMSPGYIDRMKTEITAVFATSDFAHARLYAVMRLIGSGWKSPVGSSALYVERLKPNIPEKAYVYELDSDGFMHDTGTDYYCLADKKIKRIIEIDVMQEIKNGNIRVFVLKERIDFSNMSEKESGELWSKTTHQQDKFYLYHPD